MSDEQQGPPAEPSAEEIGRPRFVMGLMPACMSAVPLPPVSSA